MPDLSFSSLCPVSAAQDLANSFHGFYTECKVVSDDEALSRARLKLCAAARIALARVLTLMGNVMVAPLAVPSEPPFWL